MGPQLKREPRFEEGIGPDSSSYEDCDEVDRKVQRKQRELQILAFSYRGVDPHLKPRR